MDIVYRQLVYLLALDRHGHFGKAAEALGISQPALSRSVLAIEKRLNTALFDRSPAGVRPTEAGKLVLAHARKVTAMSEELKADLSGLEGRARRRLAVVCGHYPAELSMPAALSRIMRRWPDAQVTMELADWNHGITLLERQVCELAVIELSAGSHSHGLSREPVNDQRIFPVVRRGHPLLHSRPPTLEGLLAFPWATSRVPERLAKYLGEGPVEAGEFDPDSGQLVPRIVASSLSTSLRLVSESDFVGVAPLVVAHPFLQSGQLELVPLSLDWMRLNYGFIRESSRPLSRIARHFMEAIRQAEVEQRVQDRQLQVRYGVNDF